MAKTLTILGSTGSIGLSTLDVVHASGGVFEVEALTAYHNVPLLAQQARQFNAKVAVIGNPDLYVELKEALADTSIEVMAGEAAIVEVAQRPSDIVMVAIVGVAALLPTMAAIERGARIGLANKECLVCAGDLMTQQAAKSGAEIIPVDSEHSAIFQIFEQERREAVSKVILTASGGPFRTFTSAQLQTVTVAQALKHPTWSMGNKITIDSATLMNKGLELIEAYHLFPVRHEQLEVIVHPESIIHGMVEYCDGSLLAQMASPDMRTPISLALAWPDRFPLHTQSLNLLACRQLTFEAADTERFPCLALARYALAQGGAFPAVLNTANEVAVEAFLKGKIGFMDIPEVVAAALEHSTPIALGSIEDVTAQAGQTREETEYAIASKARKLRRVAG